MIAVASLEPFAIWLAGRADGGRPSPPRVTLDADGRVRGRSPAAVHAGIQPAMPLAGARQLAPGLEVVGERTPAVLAGWNEVLRSAYAFSPRLLELDLGVLAFDGDGADATQFAHAFGARVGACRELELARLLAYTVAPGSARISDAPWRLLVAAPAYLLRSCGVAGRTLERLAWLGIARLGQLRGWSHTQVNAFFGPDAPPVRSLLWGPYRDRLPLCSLPATVSVRVALDAPLREPGEAHALLAVLCRRLEPRLGDRSAHLVGVVCEVGDVALRGTRRAKEGVRAAPRLLTLASYALQDSGALPLGVDALTLELGALERPAVQGTLWRRLERREKALRALSERFPDALLRFVERDPYAFDSARRFGRVNLRTGELLEDAPARGATPAPAGPEGVRAP